MDIFMDSVLDKVFVCEKFVWSEEIININNLNEKIFLRNFLVLRIVLNSNENVNFVSSVNGLCIFLFLLEKSKNII